MTTNPEILVFSAARTAIGTFGGALKDVPLTRLATTAVKAAVERSGFEPAAVGHAQLGEDHPGGRGHPPDVLRAPVGLQATTSRLAVNRPPNAAPALNTEKAQSAPGANTADVTALTSPEN